VQRYGGVAVVQDPADAEFPSMPRNALRANPTARTLPLQDLAEEVTRIVSSDEVGTAEVDPRQRELDAAEVRSALGEDPLLPDGSQIAPPSRYSCPDCGGVLNELGHETALRFRCRVGHAYTATTLLQHQAGTSRTRCGRPCGRSRSARRSRTASRQEAAAAGRDWSRMHFRRRADEARASADVLRGCWTSSRRRGGGRGPPHRAP
jgi:two-component system chemotaxis response regulator CheB